MTTNNQAGRVQIGAAQYQANPLVHPRSVSTTLQGRQAQRRSRFHCELEFAPEPQLRGANRLVTEQQCILDVTLADIPGDLADALGAQRVGRNAADQNVNRVPGLARLKQSGRQGRLQRHDARTVLKPGRNTANQAATANAHQHAVWQAGGGFNFSSQRRRTRHHFKLVVGMQQQGAAGALAQQTGLQRFGISCPGDHHAGAELTQAIPLGSTRQQRHKNLAGHRQRLRRNGRCDTRVAARRNDHTAGGNLVGKHTI